MCINTGTRAVLELVPGLVDAHPLTHIEALELDQVPGHLLVIGGRYVGLELSQAMRRFGSKLTIIDRNDRLMHREDDDWRLSIASASPGARSSSERQPNFDVLLKSEL